MAQKWPKMTQNGPKWPKYDPKWPKMALEWPKMIQNGPKLPQMSQIWHPDLRTFSANFFYWKSWSFFAFRMHGWRLDVKIWPNELLDWFASKFSWYAGIEMKIFYIDIKAEVEVRVEKCKLRLTLWGHSDPCDQVGVELDPGGILTHLWPGWSNLEKSGSPGGGVSLSLFLVTGLPFKSKQLFITSMLIHIESLKYSSRAGSTRVVI